MLINLSELFPVEGKSKTYTPELEMTQFRMADTVYDIAEKGPLSFVITNRGDKKLTLAGTADLVLEKHIKEDITLNSIIENCAISQGYLSRIFREQFKVSVTEYLHMRKLHLAKGYFYFTEDSIAEVAFRLGYNESSYFSKVFKKFENMTVKQYKKKIRLDSSGKKTEI